MSDPFDTLGIEPRFDLDLPLLERRHRDLSSALHPDRYVGRPAAERRMALDKAIAVNSAWRELRDPIRRAERLLERDGVAVGETLEPKPSPALLMEMMEVREELAEARRAQDVGRIVAIAERMRQQEREVLGALTSGFATDGERQALLPKLGELRYVRRVFEELDAIEEELMGR